MVFHKDQFFDYFNLFLLYVNDLPNSFSLRTFHSCLLIILTLFFSGKNLSHLEKTLNQELNQSVAEWIMKYYPVSACSNSKTNFILFHSNKRKTNQSLCIKIEDVSHDISTIS